MAGVMDQKRLLGALTVVNAITLVACLIAAFGTWQVFGLRQRVEALESKVCSK